jgi:hypothetical protein
MPQSFASCSAIKLYAGISFPPHFDGDRLTISECLNTPPFPLLDFAAIDW